jgi:hypothetical protein
MSQIGFKIEEMNEEAKLVNHKISKRLTESFHSKKVRRTNVKLPNEKKRKDEKENNFQFSKCFFSSRWATSQVSCRQEFTTHSLYFSVPHVNDETLYEKFFLCFISTIIIILMGKISYNV